MPEPFIKYLRIENYKSIDKLELHDIPPFAIFAGANGSGKSNFFSALMFVNQHLRFGIDEAFLLNGGASDVHCYKRLEGERNAFEFEIDMLCLSDDPQKIFPSKTSYTEQYKLLAGNLDSEPMLNEWFGRLNDGTWSKTRAGNVGTFHNSPKPDFNNPEREEIEREDLKFPIAHTTTLLNHIDSKLVRMLRTLRLFAIHPNSPRIDYGVKKYDAELMTDGHNLALVLARLQNDDEIRETIIDFMQLCVPSLENLFVQKQSLDDSVHILFKESAISKEFPARLISDGTIYLLSLLVAILDVKKRNGITMIEEPERGLHPRAIEELIALMRQRATPQSPIWLSTHSETVVRCLRDNELWFVEKENGATQIKPARSFTPNGLTRNQAWLANGLGGGLPW